ncbi:hypothetical protein DRF67_11880 [Chryseobacterium pennipullorum]|uniref:Uncharacterized protein n=1 Tax=Chryseobacterium pennipullorum TaxID=2258963 RepID=A0A3D9B219_9FLAO|nr:hypothetical protein DRF67_11880 [Chryseobacterium pennipullorum]
MGIAMHRKMKIMMMISQIMRIISMITTTSMMMSMMMTSMMTMRTMMMMTTTRMMRKMTAEDGVQEEETEDQEVTIRIGTAREDLLQEVEETQVADRVVDHNRGLDLGPDQVRVPDREEEGHREMVLLKGVLHL